MIMRNDKMLIDAINDELRRNLKSKAELARELSIEPATLRAYLSQKVKMPYDVAVRSARILHIDLNKVAQLDSSYILSDFEVAIIEEFRNLPADIRKQYTTSLLNMMRITNRFVNKK